MKTTIEESIRIVQEWKASGLTRDKFAAAKGLTPDQMRYQVRKVKRMSPESIDVSSLEKIEFTPVPPAQLNGIGRMYDAGELTDQPSLMIQAAAGCLQATNQIDPYLLRTAMEVLLSC